MKQPQGSSVIAVDGTGRPINPASGVFPILLELHPGELKVIGTAFYITRYGLFFTAAHVLFDVFDRFGKERGRMFGMHTLDDGHLNLRRVTRFTHHDEADRALGELYNYRNEFPDMPLQNLRAVLSDRRPQQGVSLVTYAYPENETLIFESDNTDPPCLFAKFFTGRYKRFVGNNEHPFLRYPHFEMSIRIRNGASGGPVFDPKGRICGIAVRSMDYDGGEFAGDELSYAVPIEYGIDLGLEDLLIPDGSWEQRQMPPVMQGQKISVRDLIKFGHVLFDHRR